jgi:hypothetical protein
MFAGFRLSLVALLVGLFLLAPVREEGTAGPHSPDGEEEIRSDDVTGGPEGLIGDEVVAGSPAGNGPVANTD